ncbi:MAG: hypothetical protein ABSA63_09710 [Thermoplasmata archaeon]|jgi:hypothetical protein
MPEQRFHLHARVSTENPAAIRPILERLFSARSITRSEDPHEFVVEGHLDGPGARDLNRSLLTSLRQAEKRTRLRSEWTCGGTTERFFDYVHKGTTVAPTSKRA